MSSNKDQSTQYGFQFLLGSSHSPQRPITSVSMEESIRQSIIMILSTEKGERSLYPQYGANLRQFMFRRNDEVLRNQIRQHVAECLSECEPRIQIESVEVLGEAQHERNLIEIEIAYFILGKEQKYSLIYPMLILE